LLSPRLENGSFLKGVTPTTMSPYYLEGDAYEYLWDVPNNYAGLFRLLGGTAKAAAALRHYLSRPDGGGTYALLGNEFGLGEQYALDYAGDPAGTQQAVNNIRTRMYLPGPYGLTANDDQGAESSQYIWEMLGMYPENPGSDILVFASPGFPRAVIDIGGGRRISINAPGASPTKFYVQSLRINGSSYEKLYAGYSELAKGSTLDWVLGSSPGRWGSAHRDAPPSFGRVTSLTG
jgi:putative alpha-1,2-mannosidase